VRARFWPGLGALATALYLTLSRLSSVVPPYPGLPLKDTLEEIWWLYPCALLALSFGPMMFAFRKLRDMREDEPRYQRLERAAFAFLANTLLDAAVLVIIAFALISVARDP
jgi:hypothetical protein